jgi:hypothetical protein
VCLVDDGVVPGHAWLAGLLPVEGLVHHQRLGHIWCAVQLVEREIGLIRPDGVAEAGVVPLEQSHEAARVRIGQQLVGVEAMALPGSVGTMHAVAIDAAGRHALEIAVPDLVGVLGQCDAFELGLAVGIEDAQLHLGRIARKQ